jgi:hypothetical protein
VIISRANFLALPARRFYIRNIEIQKQRRTEMQGFTVYNRNTGTVIGRGLTVEQAAAEILTHDSHDYDVRLGTDGVWRLYVSRGSLASQRGAGGYVQALVGIIGQNRRDRPIVSRQAEYADAWRDIAQQVITAGWDSVPVEAYTDAGYDAMMAEING